MKKVVVVARATGHIEKVPGKCIISQWGGDKVGVIDNWDNKFFWLAYFEVCFPTIAYVMTDPQTSRFAPRQRKLTLSGGILSFWNIYFMIFKFIKN